MTRFNGAGELDEAGYEQTREALPGVIGHPVLVVFSRVAGGAPRRRHRDRDAVLPRRLGPERFVVRPDEFERAFRRSDGELVAHVGHCAIHRFVAGESGTALER